MDIFFIGIATLFFTATIFYIVFFGFIYYWHLRKTSFVVVPIIFAFKFFVTGFIIVAVVSIIFYFVPYFINLFGL